MKRTMSVLALVSVLALWLACPAMAKGAKQDQEILKRLEDLSRTVQMQQDMLQKQNSEIERLKQQLGQQQQTTAETKAKVEKVEQVAAKKPVFKSFSEAFGDKFKFSTDLRLRYEGLYDRKSAGQTLDERNRFRVRWRVFGDYKVNDELSMHSMLTTSSGSWYESGTNSRNWQPGRTSNQTLDDEFNNKNVFIGRIYATYKPKWLDGLEVTAGKFKNTFLTTDMMWDPDVNPEGAYERYQYKGWKTVQPFVHFGQMVVSENNKTEDAALFLWQGGALFNLPYGIKWTVAAHYYDWQDLNKGDMSKIEGTSAGNTVDSKKLFVYDYKLLGGITFLEFKLAKLPIKLWFDYVQNQSSDVPGDKNTAWQTGFQVGNAKKKGDWSFYWKYAEIEADSMVAAVTDGDFYGTNRKGWKAMASYMLYDPWEVRLSWFDTESILGDEESEQRLQFDFIFRFSL